MHRDGSLISFSIALTSPGDFEGGGTRFVGVEKVLRPEHSGDLVTHSGKVRKSTPRKLMSRSVCCVCMCFFCVWRGFMEF